MRTVLFFIVTLCLSLSAAAEPVRVGAAISLKDSLDKIVAEYKSDAGKDVEVNYGSSGQLATQIEGGAPIDLFISAAMKQVDDLRTKHLVDASSKMIVARNRLVLIIPKDATEPASL